MSNDNFEKQLGDDDDDDEDGRMDDGDEFEDIVMWSAVNKVLLCTSERTRYPIDILCLNE